MQTNSFVLKSVGLAFIAFCLGWSGCGQNTSTQSASGVSSHPEKPVLTEDANSPDEVVKKFLTAVFRGEEKTTRALLTPLARKKGEDREIPFTLPASETARFRIEKIVPRGGVGYYVHTIWTDRDDTGQEESAEIAWIVAKTEEGWRIAGAASSLFEGQEKTIINFEDPEAARKAIADAEERENNKTANSDVREVK